MAVPTKFWVVVPTAEELASNPQASLVKYTTVDAARQQAIKLSITTGQYRLVAEVMEYADPSIAAATVTAQIVSL